MDLQQSFSSDTEPLLLTKISYEVHSRGYRVDTPVFHLRARRADGTPRTMTVEGFRPYFAIDQTDFVADVSDICNDRRVLGVEVDCSPEVWADVVGINPDELGEYDGDDVAAHLSTQTGAEVYHDQSVFTSIHDDPVARIYARVPGDVGGADGLRGDLNCDTYEADIPFERRFAISSEIYRGFEAPADEDELRFENWPGESAITGDDTTAYRHQEYEQDISPCDPPDVDARMIVYDIEVATEGGGFPDVSRARHPITAITAYDSFDDEYRCWGLAHDEWEGNLDQLEGDIIDSCSGREDFPDQSETGPALDDVNLFQSETEMLVDFHDWVLERDPDIFTGWNAGGQGGGFDTPYLIQRSYNVHARNIRRYSETGKPAVWVEERGDERQHDFILQDIVTLDLLDAYKKTQFREMDSYKLDDVAEAELGYGKTGLAGDELDDAWENSPVEFFTYNIRDTQATAEVEREAGLLDLFENLREVTGASYETAVNNGPMLDTLFLRRAFEQGLVLPSNRQPDEDVYHGAKVFDVVPGKHRNCVYPDLSSLYPNILSMTNLGPETIVGNKADLEASEYTETDCFRFPVDERPFAEVPKGESFDHIDRDEYKGVKTPSGALREIFDPEITWFYVLKPDVKESFIRDTIDELIELKNEYSGSLYAAVKRITNSVYGVLGDSASGGVGFRLYDRRVAEGITLVGRMTITHTAEVFTDYLRENYDKESYLVGGDTDSSVTSIPNAPDLETAWQWSEEACEHVDDSYDEFVVENFDFDKDDEHRLAVELESLASALFYMEDDTEHSYTTNDDGLLVSERNESGVQKRYAQHLVWDDDDGWLDTPDDDPLHDPDDRSELKSLETVTYETYEEGALSDQNPGVNVDITGFEYVRSDSAPITRDAQLQILSDILLSESPRNKIESYLNELVDDIESGEIPLEKLAKPQGVQQHLDEYGWRDIEDIADEDVTDDTEEYGGEWFQTPGPTARGAKYADDHFEWEQLENGGKPRKIPIEQVRSDDYPAAYTYDKYPVSDRPDSPEVNKPVDAIAVERLDRVPDGFVIDYDTIIEKSIEDKTEDILSTVGMEFDDLIADGRQTGLDAFT